MLQVECDAKLKPINYSLVAPAQVKMGVAFTSGTKEYCTSFGGKIAQDSGLNPPNAGGKGLFKATTAPAAACPPPPPCP
jgi:hypothetical protein